MLVKACQHLKLNCRCQLRNQSHLINLSREQWQTIIAYSQEQLPCIITRVGLAWAWLTASRQLHTNESSAYDWMTVTDELNGINSIYSNFSGRSRNWEPTDVHDLTHWLCKNFRAATMHYLTLIHASPLKQASNWCEDVSHCTPFLQFLTRQANKLGQQSSEKKMRIWSFITWANFCNYPPLRSEEVFRKRE